VEADAIWPTLDRRHVALRRARDQRRVDVYALSGGVPLATLEGALEIAVVDGRVCFTRGAEGGVELVVLAAGGGERWRRALLPPPGPPGEPIP
jgi:hypothetical protein